MRYLRTYKLFEVFSQQEMDDIKDIIVNTLNDIEDEYNIEMVYDFSYRNYFTVSCKQVSFNNTSSSFDSKLFKTIQLALMRYKDETGKELICGIDYKTFRNNLLNFISPEFVSREAIIYFDWISYRDDKAIRYNDPRLFHSTFSH